MVASLECVLSDKRLRKERKFCNCCKIVFLQENVYITLEQKAWGRQRSERNESDMDMLINT